MIKVNEKIYSNNIRYNSMVVCDLLLISSSSSFNYEACLKFFNTLTLK